MSRAHPLIGVTPGHAGPSTGREFCRSADILYCDVNYLRRIEEAGGIPVLLPHLDHDKIPEILQDLDGLMLTGGEDVHPERYGQEFLTDNCSISEARDHAEFALFHAYFSYGRPILAICRGVQLVNVALGGTLIQDIPSQCGVMHHSQKEPTELPTHEVQLAEKSRLIQIFGESYLPVNSHHHQAVDQPGRDLEPSAWTDEGIIEGIEHQTHPYLMGVQWHPERLLSCLPVQRKLFHDFIRATRHG
jgi:putative glutamine amidotransferase